jgi:hypothetical protein
MALSKLEISHEGLSFQFWFSPGTTTSKMASKNPRMAQVMANPTAPGMAIDPPKLQRS